MTTAIVREEALLGAVHTGLEQVMAPRDGPRAPSGRALGHRSPDAADTFALIDDLLNAARGQDGRGAPRDAFDELAVHRLVERRALLERHAHRRPPTPDGPATGWVHGDFHPLNLLYRGADPVAIVDWDRLDVQPRAEEAVRAAAILLRTAGGRAGPREGAGVRPRVPARGGGGGRGTGGGGAPRVVGAAQRLLDTPVALPPRRPAGPDPQFPAVSALAVWWTREYEAVCAAFTE
ncbi:phosphotransferase [Streptomyces californicus]